MMNKYLWALCWVLAWPAWSQDGQVHEFMLDNGMKVIVQPDHRAPVVTSQVWYKVGSSYEMPGQTGVSHVLEHMMFKGTKHVPPDEFSRIIAALGGSENAFTGQDYTAYFETLAKQHLERALELEADRMVNLLFDPKEFQHEVAVVREERRLRTDDSPTGLLYEQFNAVAWRVSPYRNPIIGWMHDLEHMSEADLRRWYERWYRPQNAILVVVGDVEPQNVLALAKKHFEPIRKGPFSPPIERPEPKQHGITRLELQIPAKQPVLLMGYKTPNLATANEPWEAYALQVLASILSGGESARLPERLIRQQKLAVSASASYDAFTRLPGMLELEALPAAGVSLETLEQGLREQIHLLQQTPISKEELQRVIHQILAEKVYARDSIFYQAMLIGMRETTGFGWRSLEQELEEMKKITPEQVQQVAQRYLTPERLTVAWLQPSNSSNHGEQK